MRGFWIGNGIFVLSLIFGTARTGEANVQVLMEKLAAQSAQLEEQRVRLDEQRMRLDDMQAKFSAPKEKKDSAIGVTSLRKNAVVTVGGNVESRYYYFDADVKTSRPANAGNAAGVPAWDASTSGRVKREDIKMGDLSIYTAQVMLQVQVNEHFDAYVRMNLHDGYRRRNVSGLAQNYWIRWKNICETGFGVLIGRDGIKYGDGDTIGVVMGYAGGQDGLGEVTWVSKLIQTSSTNLATNGQILGDGMFAGNSLVPYHTGFDFGRTTQINPYWENHDKTLRLDLSLLQSRERMTGGSYSYDDDGITKSRSINYGLGSGTARVVWRPIEGLKLTASALNFYTNSNHGSGVFGYKANGAWGSEWGKFNDYIKTASNNSAVNLAVQYRPASMNKLNLWAQWNHGWNEAWVKDMDSDSLNVGLSFKFTDRLTGFVQGDYLRVTNAQSDVWNKGTAWSFYTGLVYALPYGVNMEAGWKHERIAYYDRGGDRHTEIRGDTIYGHLGFKF